MPTIKTAEKVWWYLNTPRRIQNFAQQTVWAWAQGEPFANDTPNQNPNNLGTFEFPLWLMGTYADQETGTFYNGRRQLDQGVGRYQQADPLGLRAGINPYAHVRNDPLRFTDPDGQCPCSGGTWDQEMGDFGVQAAAGIVGQASNVNLSCRSNKSLRCSAKQYCIGGGAMLGAGASWTLGGVVSGKDDSNSLPGWDDLQIAVSAGWVSVQGSGSGAQASGGPNAGWIGGAAVIRCYTAFLKCNCPCEN